MTTNLDPVEAQLLEQIREVRSRPLVPLVSRLAREAGTWRAHADRLARIVRNSAAATVLGGRLPAEAVDALASYDHLVALVDDDQAAG